jgi:hypothetical protein
MGLFPRVAWENGQHGNGATASHPMAVAAKIKMIPKKKDERFRITTPK